MSFFYPDTFEIAGQTYKGSRNSKKSQVYIPFTQEPPVTIGDTIFQKVGSATRIELKVTDLEIHENSGDDTRHTQLLTLTVHNVTESLHKPQAPAPISIGSINAGQVQVGSHNQLITNITLNDVVQQVAAKGDEQAKGLLLRLLENQTVSSIIGAGASVAFTALLGK